MHHSPSYSDEKHRRIPPPFFLGSGAGSAHGHPGENAAMTIPQWC